MKPICGKQLITGRYGLSTFYSNPVINVGQKSTCSDHKAVNRVNTTQGHLQATWIGAVACARHGCFFPQSVVDFQKAEGLAVRSSRSRCLPLICRQMNIDYAVCQSLCSMANGSRVIAIYDVACQWGRNFRRRVKSSNFLDIPAGLDIIPAVGKWHLGAHVADCFPKFSLNFIQGIGQVDGEILETLWSITNKVAGTTWAMGKSHRSEVLDENMYDSNWKKWVGIGESTSSMYSYLNMADYNGGMNSPGIGPQVQNSRGSIESGRRCFQGPDKCSWQPFVGPAVGKA